MEQEQDRAERVLRAIPYMSKEIVDDTLYEKVLSFLSSFIAKGKDNLSLFRSWNVLDIISQAWEQPGQDYRVHALCARLLGCMVSCDPEVFDDLIDNYPAILHAVSECLWSTEPAVRCACLEGLRGFLSCQRAVEWLMNNERIKTGIDHSFADHSIYVVTESCRLFRMVMEKSLECKAYCDLAQAIDPSEEIKRALHPGADLSVLMPALEFTWNIANSRTPAALDYITGKNLFFCLLPLLGDQNRIVRSRVTEILSVIYEWAPSPKHLLVEGSSSETGPKEAYEHIMLVAISLIRNPGSSEHAAVAVSLMGLATKLLIRLNEDSNSMVALESHRRLLVTLLLIALGKSTSEEPVLSFESKDIAHGLREKTHTLSSKRAIIKAVLEQLDNFSSVVSVTKTDTYSLGSTLAVFDAPDILADQRVLKVTLGYVLTLLRGLAQWISAQEMEDIVSKAIDRLSFILHGIDMDPQSVSLVLDSFHALLCHEILGELLTDTGVSRNFVSSLKLMFLDEDWDVRDAAIQFVGSLFKEPLTNSKIAFAITHDLPLLVLARIQDQESYVRASAVDVLQSMMRNQEGWMFLQRNQHTHHIASRLPPLLYDSEAFVRRAALDAIGCLVENRSCEGLPVEKHSTGKAVLSLKLCPSVRMVPDILDIAAKLMDDPDSEVRIRMCRVFGQLWQLHQHEREQKKRSKFELQESGGAKDEESIFYILDGQKWIVEATKDTQRLVRAEAYRIITTILRSQDEMVPSVKEGKRSFADVDDNDQKFLQSLRELDLAKLEQTVDPEHIYQEAFDIDADMMTHSLRPTNPDDDTNMLDCY